MTVVYLLRKARNILGMGVAAIVGFFAALVSGGWVLELDFSQSTIPRPWSVGEFVAMVAGLSLLWLGRQRLAVWELDSFHSRVVSVLVSSLVLIGTLVTGLLTIPGILKVSPDAQYWVPLVNSLIIVALAVFLTPFFGENYGVTASCAVYVCMVAVQALDGPFGRFLPLAQFAHPSRHDFVPWLVIVALMTGIAVAASYRSVRLVTRDVDT